MKKKFAGGRTTSGFSTGRQIVATATALLVALAVLFSAAGILFSSAGTVAAATVTTITAGTGPMGVSYNPTANKVYLGNGNFSALFGPRTAGKTVSVVDCVSDTLVDTITIAGGTVVPANVCYNSNNHQTYETNIIDDFAGSVGRVELTVPPTITKSGATGLGTAGITYHPSRDEMWITNALGTTLDRLNPTTLAKVSPTPITVGRSPVGMAYRPSTQKMYVACSGSQTMPPNIDNRVFVVNSDLTQDTPITVGTAPIGCIYDSVDDRIFVGNNGSSTVSVINPTTAAVVNTIPVGPGPFGMCYNPILNRIYTANIGTTDVPNNTVSVIDCATQTVVDTITVGTAPMGLDVNPSTNKVYVGNFGTDAAPGTTVSIIDDTPPNPTTTSLVPDNATAGTGAFTLTVNGTGFVAGSVVRWDGSARATTYVSGNQLTAAIPASDIAAVGSADVTVYNAGAAIPESTPALAFTINAPPNPTTNSIDPTSKIAGQGAFTLTVNGANFVDGVSQVRWNGNLKTTTYVSGIQLTAAIPASDIASAGTANVTVRNPLATNPDSNAQIFTINAPPVPTTTGIDPTSATAGGAGFILTVNGTNFLDGISVVRWNGSARTTTYVSATQLTAAIPASDIAAGGTVPVTVLNGASESNAQTFTINQALNPVITSVDPLFGPPGTQVTITGNNFGNTQGASYVSFNGVAATEYASWSNTMIVCTVPEGATAGPVTVVTPAGTSNADKIFTVSYPTWYLAEGSTAWGFDEYISIENPNAEACTAKITYMTSTGPTSPPNVSLPASSQTTVNPRDLLGAQDFSTKVECLEGKTIAVDRTMTWTGPGAASPEAHNSIGVPSPENTWYLAEGSSAWGFECWLLIQNPNSSEATCQVTYMVEGSGPHTVTKKVPANSRRTYNMADDIGNADASIKVEATLPVIPERAMYRNNRREGHDSIGTTTPAADYFLAEGTTAWGFTTYVLIQNPNQVVANVTVTYMTPDGTKSMPTFKMEPSIRKTIRVNDVLPNTDMSTLVQADQPIIAERAMYWGADKPLGEACHDSIGMDSPHMTFYLPDGQTTEGRETWTLVQNPNAEAVTVQISYLTPSGAGNVVFTDTVPANARKTYNMANQGINGRAAIMVASTTAGKKIMVERAMYWNSRGAGTDTIGGYSD